MRKLWNYSTIPVIYYIEPLASDGEHLSTDKPYACRCPVSYSLVLSNFRRYDSGDTNFGVCVGD